MPNVPYCWQKKGETIELPSSKSKTLQVLGFLRRDHTFRFYYAEGSVDSLTVVGVFEDFISTLDANKKSVIVIDNAPPRRKMAAEGVPHILLDASPRRRTRSRCRGFFA